jgi:hypothetical protein
VTFGLVSLGTVVSVLFMHRKPETGVPEICIRDTEYEMISGNPFDDAFSQFVERDLFPWVMVGPDSDLSGRSH